MSEKIIEQIVNVEREVKHNLSEVEKTVTSIKKLIDKKNYDDANIQATCLSNLILHIKGDIIALIKLTSLLEED